MITLICDCAVQFDDAACVENRLVDFYSIGIETLRQPFQYTLHEITSLIIVGKVDGIKQLNNHQLKLVG